MASFCGGTTLTRTIFNKHDKDKNGSLDPTEFRNLCYEFGHYFSDEQLAIAILRFDRNGNTSIEYDEFLEWWRHGEDRFNMLALDEEQQEEMFTAIAYFQACDTDNSGVIEWREFSEGGVYNELKTNGFNIPDTVEKCFEQLDTDGNGVISFNEYIDWLISTGSLPSLQRETTAGLTAEATPAESAPAPAPVVISPRALAEIGTYYTFEELVSGVPAGVDSARKEEYLDPATFKAKFGVDKSLFLSRPKWKRDNQKKTLGLF